MTDFTHDPRRRSWVASANGHADFPVQNLPLGVFSPTVERQPRGGVAIGDAIFDIAAACECGLFSGEAETAAIAASGASLNSLMALDGRFRRTLRQRIFALLDSESEARARVEPLANRLLHDAAGCELYLPAVIGDFTDFYACIHHAENVGRQFRPENPLLPNYKYVPIGYHGRSSSIRPSGDLVRRPSGQIKSTNMPTPEFGLSQRLDYELELGIWIGPGNVLGQPIPIEAAGSHVFGLSLLNDWSARDIQSWEYQPLGPFLSKSFATTISPWIVTREALEPFRVALPSRPAGDPQPLTYLYSEQDQRSGAFDITLDVSCTTRAMREARLPPQKLSRCNARDLYWTVAQLIVHHTSGGCNLRPGDLLGSGTISSADPSQVGSLLELTKGGNVPVNLPTGEQRTFLQDGDEILFRGTCHRDGFASIGLGEARGLIIG